MKRAQRALVRATTEWDEESRRAGEVLGSAIADSTGEQRVGLLRGCIAALSRAWLRVRDAHRHLSDERRRAVEARAMRAEELARALAADERLRRAEERYMREQLVLASPVAQWELVAEDVVSLRGELQEAQTALGSARAAARRRAADGVRSPRADWDAREAEARVDCLEATLARLNDGLDRAPWTEEERAERHEALAAEVRAARNEWQSAVGLPAPAGVELPETVTASVVAA